MSSPDKESHVPGGGLFGNTSAFSGDLVSYFRLRAELLLIESREAGSVLGKSAALLAVAAFCGLTTYLLLLLVIAQLIGGLLASWGDSLLSNWFGGAAVLAGIHLLVALVFVLKCRGLKPGELFEHSKSEWEKDRLWLHTEKKNQS